LKKTSAKIQEDFLISSYLQKIEIQRSLAYYHNTLPGIADQQSKEFWRNLHRHRAKVVQQALERGESQPAFPELPADRKVGFQYVGE
jgi:hypothetical protein